MDENNNINPEDNTGADPMYPNTEGQDGDNNATPPENTGGMPSNEPSQAAPIAETIAQRLAGEDTSTKEEGAVETETPMPFDIAKLSREQIQTLKSMLAATPDAQSRKKENPRVKLRRIDGNLVVDFKNAYLGLMRDAELNREVERHVIPVLLEGQKEYTPILYRKFINSEQIVCEVVESRQVVEEFIEGQTTSRETGLPVEMVRKEVRNWFTVKLPEGRTVEIEAKIANA